MNAESRSFPRGEIRVSDAERDLAVAELSEHFQAGRLSQDEFDDRSGRALQARTGADLNTLNHATTGMLTTPAISIRRMALFSPQRSGSTPSASSMSSPTRMTPKPVTAISTPRVQANSTVVMAAMRTGLLRTGLDLRL